ncbi:MAG: PP2C family protein-serine/threonine phosphatase [Vicinamibacterales bacterium]|nr:PP2C family protein-serine/threonine phosphatase [Vicinamibacterales bacterium]
MREPDSRLDEELRKGARYLSQRLMPTAGAIPRIPGIDIHGVTIPLNGVAGGDLITYVNFQERFDLDARIRRAVDAGHDDMARMVQKLKLTGGILVADVAGHDFADAARAAMLHQAFHTGALYEMDLNGQITLRLFEQINTRFCKSSTLRNLAAGPDEASYITLIYGEISSTGRFSFVSAGHPQPLVFSREFDRFVEVSQDRLVSYSPIGLQPGEHHADARRYERALGYKKRYTVNNLNLLGQGDVLLLYTDGLIEPLSAYTQAQLEAAVSRAKDGNAQLICEAIVGDRQATTAQTDDLTLVVIKYR